MTCRYDREAEVYRTPDGEPCRTDDYGDRTYHCTAPRCGNHIGRDELTCPRCIGRVRSQIRGIVQLAALMMPEALDSGVNSEAASLAGPAADVEAWTWRKMAARRGGSWHASLPVELGGDPKHVEEDDEHHPYAVLTRWQMMLSEDYGHPLPDELTAVGAADYLDRNMSAGAKFAHDPNQDFRLFAEEIRACLAHMDAVIRNSQAPERGAPCPDCASERKMHRMRRVYPHWCEDPLCERFHYSVVLDRETGEFVPDTTADIWVCPANPTHWRSHADYTRWVEERDRSVV